MAYEQKRVCPSLKSEDLREGQHSTVKTSEAHVLPSCIGEDAGAVVLLHVHPAGVHVHGMHGDVTGLGAQGHHQHVIGGHADIPLVAVGEQQIVAVDGFLDDALGIVVAVLNRGSLLLAGGLQETLDAVHGVHVDTGRANVVRGSGGGIADGVDAHLGVGVCGDVPLGTITVHEATLTGSFDYLDEQVELVVLHYSILLRMLLVRLMSTCTPWGGGLVKSLKHNIYSLFPPH